MDNQSVSHSMIELQSSKMAIDLDPAAAVARSPHYVSIHYIAVSERMCNYSAVAENGKLGAIATDSVRMSYC